MSDTCGFFSGAECELETTTTRPDMKILLTGTFDVDNYGDCLLPTVYQNELGQRLRGLELVLSSPTSCAAGIGCYKSLQPLPHRHHKGPFPSFDAVVIAGGNVLTSGHNAAGLYSRLPPYSLSPGLRIWMTPFLIKNAHPASIIINNPGVGNLGPEAARALRVCLGHADMVSVRDAFSLQALHHIGASGSMGADPAFAVRRLMRADQWRQRAASLLPPELRLDGYLVAQITYNYLTGKDLSEWCASVNALARVAQLPILLLPICYHNSDAFLLKRASRVLAAMGTKHVLMRELLKTVDTAALIGCSGGYCGTSLHGAITAISFARPLVSVCRFMNGKHAGVLDAVNCHGVVVNQFSKFEEAFSLSMNADRNGIAGHAEAMAMNGFDEIARVGKVPPQSAHLNTEELHLLEAAAQVDYDYYKSFSRRCIRLAMSYIRSIPLLNDWYNSLSFAKNERFQSERRMKGDLTRVPDLTEKPRLGSL